MCYLQPGMWHVECGRAEMIRFLSHRDDSAVTKHWLYYLGGGHFDPSETTGSCQVHVCSRAWECFHNLVCIISAELKLVPCIFYYPIRRNRKRSLVCKSTVCVWVHVRVNASHQESGSWCVASPRGLSGDGPSSQHCSKGSWFPVQSPCVCCFNTSESKEQLAHANKQRE